MAGAARCVWRKYREFLIHHPEKMGQIESVISAASYITPGSSEFASVFSELISAGSSLLTLLNDAILRREAKIRLDIPVGEQQLRTWLSVIECVEVLLEITAMATEHAPVRWMIVVLIQILKAIIRFLLLLKHKSGLYVSPAVPSLKRDSELKEKLLSNSELVPSEARALLKMEEEKPLIKSDATTFTLERSGKVVRSLKATPPYGQRTWKLPAEEKTTPSTKTDVNHNQPKTLQGSQRVGESLNILRPLLHLLGLYKFGEASWKPWLLACGIDISSLCLIGPSKEYSKNEQSELRRRTLMMLLYFLRSPFYDRYSRAKIFFLLTIIGNKLPGGKMIEGALVDYLPWWQEIYAYVWMS